MGRHTDSVLSFFDDLSPSSIPKWTIRITLRSDNKYGLQGNMDGNHCKLSEGQITESHLHHTLVVP